MEDTDSQQFEELWHTVLTQGEPTTRRTRHIFGLLPSEPRCQFCNAPFGGLGGRVVRLLWGKQPAADSTVLCNFCADFARAHPGGAEVEITMLFADVRGSTRLGEQLGANEFSRLMNRFYHAAGRALVHTDAWIDKLVGDEIIGLYIPGFAGPHHAHMAIHGAQQLLHATGHDSPDGPWIPVGVGVHTGTPYIGVVGSADVVKTVTALGDPMNLTARLVSHAAAGEIVISEAACQAAGLDTAGLEPRTLEVKGKTDPIQVFVMHVGRHAP